MSSSTHATNRTNNISVLGKDFIKRINNTTIQKFMKKQCIQLILVQLGLDYV